MLNILINSYTCCPGMGSEPGMGWNWITALAKTGEVELYVISEGEYASKVLETLENEKGKREHSVSLQTEVHERWAERIHFYWNPVSPSTREKCWNQGNWSFYPLYEKWQKKTAEIAREICSKEKIDILHQLNMIGFREPGYLWQVSKETGIPLVWGPVDAKDKFPLAYANGTSLKTKAFLWLKNTISILQLKYSGRVRKAAKQASVLLGASSNSIHSFKKYMGVDAILMNETGCRINSQCIVHNSLSKNFFDILWVGKMDFRKQLEIAIRSLAMAKEENLKLHIVGGGNDATYKRLAEELDVCDRISWYGTISHSEVQRLMQKCDILLFTSVAEGTPHVVLEAIANGLPVVCHDTCGHGDCVDNSIGIKIPLSTPEQSVKDFAHAINELYAHRERLEEMSANCPQKAEELSWERKAQKMLELYKAHL